MKTTRRKSVFSGSLDIADGERNEVSGGFERITAAHTVFLVSNPTPVHDSRHVTLEVTFVRDEQCETFACASNSRANLLGILTSPFFFVSALFSSAL